MHDDTLREAIDQLVLERINDCGSRKNETVQEAYAQLSACAEKLNQFLSPEQRRILMDCEDAFALMDGETMQCFYRAGFADAVSFLLGWRDGTWN